MNLFARSALTILATFIFLSCQPTNEQSNAVRDLLIDRIVWKPYVLSGDSASATNQHQFAITNTSSRYGYRQILISCDYYTQAGRQLGSDTTLLDTLIAPGTVVKFADRRIGRLRPETDRTAIQVLKATPQ